MFYSLYRYGTHERHYSIDTDDSSSVNDSFEMELESEGLFPKRKSRWKRFQDFLCTDWKAHIGRYKKLVIVVLCYAPCFIGAFSAPHAKFSVY